MKSKYVIDQFALKDNDGVIIQAGAPRVAEALGVEVSTVYKWKYDKTVRGTGGIVPTSKQDDVLKAAKLNNIYLDPIKLYGIEDML